MKAKENSKVPTCCLINKRLTVNETFSRKEQNGLWSLQKQGVCKLLRHEFAWRNFTFVYDGTSKDLTRCQWPMNPYLYLFYRTLLAFYQVTWISLSTTVVGYLGEYSPWKWPISVTNLEDVIMCIYYLLALVSYVKFHTTSKVGSSSDLVSKIRVRQHASHAALETHTIHGERINPSQVPAHSSEDYHAAKANEVSPSLFKIPESSPMDSTTIVFSSEIPPQSRRGTLTSLKSFMSADLGTQESNVSTKGSASPPKNLPFILKLQWYLFNACTVMILPKMLILIIQIGDQIEVRMQCILTCVIISLEIFMVTYPVRISHVWHSVSFYAGIVILQATLWALVAEPFQKPFDGGFDISAVVFLIAFIVLPAIHLDLFVLTCARRLLYVKLVLLKQTTASVTFKRLYSNKDPI